MKMAVQYLNIPIFVMIRPRGGDFCYTKEEIESMKEDILVAKSLGVQGIVLGVLTKDKKLDLSSLQYLIEAAKPMKITFHKAIDEMENPLEAIPKLIELGCNRILTSGKQERALEGVPLLNKMIEKANGKIIIVAAGKVTSENIKECSEKFIQMSFMEKNCNFIIALERK